MTVHTGSVHPKTQFHVFAVEKRRQTCTVDGHKACTDALIVCSTSCWLPCEQQMFGAYTCKR